MFSFNIYFKKCLGVKSEIKYQKWCRYYNTGEYSSNVSRIFNNINDKLKKKNNKSIEYEKCDKVVIKDIKDIYKQYESVIKKINFSKMMGRDLSYCMNILSKINYFKEHIFWIKCANRLIKGFMIHRINTQSYYIISNALSKGTVLYDKDINIGDEVSKFEEIENGKMEKKIKNIIEGPKFCRINFDGTVKLNKREDKTNLDKKNNSNIKKYHKIYEEISIRFLYDVKRMNIDEISCILNLFSKLNLNEYNLLSYYFSDYFVMSFLKNKINFEKYTNLCYSEINREDVEKKPNICFVEKYDISKLIIILHSLVNSHVTHVEFLYICCYYFNKNFEYLNNIDICNILYSFGKNSDWLLRKKYRKYIFLKRITDKQYVSYIKNIVEGIKEYGQFYNNNNKKDGSENLCYIEKLYFNNEKIDIGNSLCSINKIYEKGEIYYSSLLTKILKHIQKEKVLNKFSCIQISSIVLSLIKLKINSLNIFHSFNYKVIEMWKEFSLRCIADYLYSKYEINLSNDYVLFLLFYKFVQIIFHKYMEEFEKIYPKHDNHINSIKQSKEGIYFFQKNYKKIKILNTRDSLLIVRIFQSFSKGDTKNSLLNDQNFKSCYDYLYCLEYVFMLYKNKENERQLKGSVFIENKFNTNDDDDDNRNNKGEYFWRELESTNNSSIPLLNNFDKKYEAVKRLTFRTLCLSLFQHLDNFSFEYKCLISYFSINISDYFYLVNYEGDEKKLNDHFLFCENSKKKKDSSYYINKNVKMNHCHKEKVPYFEVSRLCRSFSSRMLFHVLNEMKCETLNEVTLRQIYTCILCLYLNIINIWDIAKIKLKNDKKKYLLLLGNVILQEECKSDLKYLNFYKKNINTILMNTNKMPDFTIFHFISLNILKKIAIFLDKAMEKNYQQNEISISSKMHNDISNFLRTFISNMNEKREKKIKQRNEIVVGPFVLDCILE
ncbi:hypothetical protein, variant 3 [Plasmodium yoelii 17X]|uniref:Uncharacterized protein n=1 Tax=Plasmodium yoelii 17X TaxID=1323249 RepID=V7PPB7_PLAYE|nr:hypothetical protein, variant 2 [Plasmodium yoelii 17X]ETB60815.1 hypothetical protein, variant 3 [Plasmodium yoelii 17X]